MLRIEHIAKSCAGAGVGRVLMCVSPTRHAAVMDRAFASWNETVSWLRKLQGLREGEAPTRFSCASEARVLLALRAD